MLLHPKTLLYARLDPYQEGYNHEGSESLALVGDERCGGVFLIRPQWRKLWVSSLLLTALCGFAYGWKEREENPPPIITIEKEPPETRLLKKGRYDEAAKAILDSIKDEG